MFTNRTISGYVDAIWPAEGRLLNLGHICLSDLHCGAPTGLLTPTDTDPGIGSDPARLVSDTFAKALLATVKIVNSGPPPAVIFLGDIFDLSLGQPAAATAVLRYFLDQLKMNGGVSAFGRFLFVPGNHDHELWTALRYQQQSDPPGSLDHVTPAFAATETWPGPALLDQLLKKSGFKFGCATYYPNLGLRSKDGSRVVMFHHGHFVEAMYTLMSRLLSQLAGGEDLARTVADMERINGSWIDFIWSTLGDDGLLGKDIFLAYEYLMTGGETADFQHRLSRLIADKLAGSLPLWRTKAMREALDLIASGLVDSLAGSLGQLERFSYTQVLGDGSLKGLKDYLDGPVWRQMGVELEGKMPTDMTFVFGHTHKPFEDRVPSSRFTFPPAVYNTGGWILDTPMFGTVEGASVLFVDDQLNTAALRLFGAPADDGPALPGSTPVPVRVTTADGLAPGDNPMAAALQASLVKTAPLWAAFAKAADASYRDKQAYIIATLDRADAAARRTGTVL